MEMHKKYWDIPTTQQKTSWKYNNAPPGRKQIPIMDTAFESFITGFKTPKLWSWLLIQKKILDTPKNKESIPKP